MAVAVITPYFKKPAAWLQQCLDSVQRQTMPCTHILVCDGDSPQGVEFGPHVQVIHLPQPHKDYGSVARAIGSASAIGQGYDAIAWLDADNWYERDHIEAMWAAHRQTNAAVCTATRTIHALSGDVLGPCTEVDGKTFVDTNCFFLLRPAFGLLGVWYLMPPAHHCVGDRVFWKAVVDSKLPRTHVSEPTVCYRSGFAAHYHLFGKEPPPDAKEKILAPVSPPARERVNVEPSAEKQGISLCMIVKNEEANLGDCLATVRDLVDEIIVVDTGSTDQTRLIAEQYGAKVFHFEWIDDFSAARNCALGHATQPWIFWMDADDRLNPANRVLFQRLKDQLPDGNYAYMMKQWSPPDQPLGSPLVVDHVRLFRRQPNVAWSYRLHEQILPSLKGAKAKIVVTDIVIDHLGYADPSLRRRKLERNLRILLQEHQQQPEDAFVLFNLAGTYFDVGDADKGVSFLHQCVEKAPAGASFLPKAFVLLIQRHRLTERLEEAARTVTEAQRLFPRSAEVLFEAGLVQQARGEHAAAQTSFETILNLPRGGPQFVGTDEGVFNHLSRHQLAIALRAQGALSAAEAQWRLVTEQATHFAPAWLALVEVLLEQKRFADAEGLCRPAQASPQSSLITPVIVARLQLARKEVLQAVETLEGALRTAPANNWLRFFLIDVMTRHAMDPERTKDHLRQILAVDPNHRQANAKLADLTERTSPAVSE